MSDEPLKGPEIRIGRDTLRVALLTDLLGSYGEMNLNGQISHGQVIVVTCNVAALIRIFETAGDPLYAKLAREVTSELNKDWRSYLKVMKPFLKKTRIPKNAGPGPDLVFDLYQMRSNLFHDIQDTYHQTLSGGTINPTVVRAMRAYLTATGRVLALCDDHYHTRLLLKTQQQLESDWASYQSVMNLFFQLCDIVADPA